MENCKNCASGCGNCSGCSKDLVLTPAEVALLQALAQIPFLPVARKADDMTPVYLENVAEKDNPDGLALALLEKRGLIDIDYRMPLQGFDYTPYKGFPVHGSIALTQKGQQVVELLELQGIREES